MPCFYVRGKTERRDYLDQQTKELWARIGCYVDRTDKGTAYVLTETDVEYLARHEHDLLAAVCLAIYKME